MNIDTLEKLRALYAAPKERAIRKQLSALDSLCRRFIELSPFVVIASGNVTQAMDASPRGGAPGFVKALMRSGLWRQSSQVPRSLLPTMGQMINGQTGIEASAETQEEMLARYAADL